MIKFFLYKKKNNQQDCDFVCLDCINKTRNCLSCKGNR